MHKLTFDPGEIKKIEVEGIPVYLKSLPWANNWLEIRVGILAGALQDEIGKEGTAHFFEHLPFDGTAKYPSFEKMEEISRTVFMDTLNAYTNMSGTCFTGKVTERNIEKGFDVLREMMFFPILNDKEIERERKVIMQEIWRSFNDPKNEKLIDEINRDIYNGLPFSEQAVPFGWSFTLSKITKEDILNFHKKNYHKNNLVFAIVGDIKDEEKIKNSVKTFLKDLPSGEMVTNLEKVLSVPDPRKQKIEISEQEYFGTLEEAKSNKTYIQVTKLLPHVNDEEDAKRMIFKGLLRRMLYNEIRGKIGDTYSPSVNVLNRQSISYLRITLSVKPEIKEQVVSIIKDCIERIKNADKSILNLFDEGKEALIDYLKTMEFNGDSISDAIIESAFKRDPLNTLEEEITNIEKVSFESIAEFAKKELDLEKFHWYIKNP